MSDRDQHQYKDRYMLRLPDGMRDRIKAAADENNRSMNAEIVARLESSFEPAEEITMKHAALVAAVRERALIEEEIRAIDAARIDGAPDRQAMFDIMYEIAKAKAGVLSRMIHQVDRDLKSSDEEDYLHSLIAPGRGLLKPRSKSADR